MIRLLPAKDLQRSGFVARVFALRDVVLAELAANRAKPFHAIATDDAARISVHIEDSADAALLNDGSELVVQVLFKVTAKQSEVAVVTVAGQFDLRYARQFDEGKVSEEDAKLFSKINGVYNAWPYMRELVANTFTRLGYPPFTMDSLVVAPQPEESKVAAKA